MVYPNQGHAFPEKQGGKERATAQTPPFPHLAATTPSRLPWTEQE